MRRTNREQRFSRSVSHSVALCQTSPCVRGGATIEPSERGTVFLCARLDAKWTNIVDWMTKSPLTSSPSSSVSDMFRLWPRVMPPPSPSSPPCRRCEAPCSFPAVHIIKPTENVNVKAVGDSDFITTVPTHVRFKSNQLLIG